jgi:antitoxin component of RelBE/YafQ-DinJ toxin-antitoxin module
MVPLIVAAVLPCYSYIRKEAVLRQYKTEGVQMDPVVTGRVPEAVRNRGNAVLKEIGSSPSELINAAYDYVIRERRLPKAVDLPDAGTRTLTEAQAAELLNFMKRVRVEVPSEWDGVTFDELFDPGMRS